MVIGSVFPPLFDSAEAGKFKGNLSTSIRGYIYTVLESIFSIELATRQTKACHTWPFYCVFF